MHANGRDHAIALGIDHAEVVGIGVDDVDLIPSRVRSHAGRALADGNGLKDGESTKVDYGYRVAAAVGDVGVLVVVGNGFRSLAAAAQTGQE